MTSRLVEDDAAGQAVAQEPADVRREDARTVGELEFLQVGQLTESGHARRRQQITACTHTHTAEVSRLSTMQPRVTPLTRCLHFTGGCTTAVVHSRLYNRLGELCQ